MKLRISVLVITVLFGVSWEGAQSASLRVSPARFIVHNVKPGVLYDVYEATRLRLTIFNDDSVDRTWRLTTHRPSERGSWEEGYSEIPDPAWVWFEETEVKVPAGGKGHAYLKLRVPEDDRYFNQHWIVTLGIGSGPGAGPIALAVDIRVQIETASLADPPRPPAGPFTAAPSLVRFLGLEPGERQVAGLSIYNGATAETAFSLQSLFKESTSDKEAYLTSSFQRIPNVNWVEYPSSVLVPPSASASLEIAVEIPDSTECYGMRWEDVILIVSPEGRPGFLRVQIDTVHEDKGVNLPTAEKRSEE